MNMNMARFLDDGDYVSTSNIPCNISFATSTQIICQLPTSLVRETKLLPISISVDQVYTQTYKPHIYSILMQYSFSIVCEDRFFSTILFGGDYEGVNRLMIDKVTMGVTFNAPYIGSFDSQEMYQCFNRSLDLIGYDDFRFWQGVSFTAKSLQQIVKGSPIRYQKSVG
ncbi:hypothetical protein DFA_03138 [Cavenderia fasciculata]|uniref:IPT/TIG domain-containing protein n=1 Tax=Cavenderia fasciculata TaxID=261658 RepID=F4PGQ9_CACFS|nr:uncharacterized protein DFA_03138 [Cavenderia fasciculata]EGG24893.1 hypothetical protein DFA_03138 [Cavenderia fasciculata]|eukprot:XP_004362744.1 hypothetical protein DFA_03138 [Cavenderia fasciculata]